MNLFRELMKNSAMTFRIISSTYFDTHREAAKKRLQRLCAAGYLRRHEHRTVEGWIYSITRKSFQALQDRGVVDSHSSWAAIVDRVRVMHPKTEHQLAILAFGSVLAHALRNTAWRLVEYQKPQLSHLFSELLGPVHAPDPSKKKSEIINSLLDLFNDAASGKLGDTKLVEKVNAWLPANLREPVAPRSPK